LKCDDRWAPDKEVKGVKEVKTIRRQAVLKMVRVAACVFTSLTLFTSLYAMAGARQSQAPVFKSKVEIVQLDVSVLDKHRQPIKGLTEKDFTILEDGKPQKIVAFSTFDMDDAAPPATGWMRDVPPDVTTNDLKPESRLFVLVMDDAMIPQEPFAIKSAKEIARNIIDRLGPNDLTAVIFTGDNRKTQDFTSDKTKLIAALDRFNPGLASYRFGVDTQALDTDMHFYMSSVRTLSSVADYLISIPNRRKALFWVSPGVPLDLADLMPRSAPLGGSPVTGAQAGGTIGVRDLQDRTQEIFAKAQNANVTIYPIDPTGLDGMRHILKARLSMPGMFTRLVVGNEPGGLPLPGVGDWEAALATFSQRKSNALQDFLVSTATNTGGRAIVNTNEFGPAIGEIFEENKSYYLLAFEPANPAADGKLHKIAVKVDRPDVDIRTRSQYYAPQAVTKEDKKIAKSGMTPEAVALAKSMAGILPTVGMPLRASAAAIAVPGQRLSTVTVVLGVRQPVPSDAANGRVTETTELLTSAFTPEGDPKGTQKHTAKVVLRAGATGEAAYEVLARIDLPAGRYQLRLAAHSTTAGKDGSVFVDVTVPDYSNIPFSASPVVLSATPGRVSAPKDLFSSLLPLTPTAEREFEKTDKVTAFLRLYQSGQKPIERVTVAMNIRNARDQVEATETRGISPADFPAVGQQLGSEATMPQPINRGGIMVQPPQPAADKFANLALRSADVKYAIPMAKLSPGPHLLTMETTLGATTIRRDVRFEVK
jgi:VWFA-related protein